MQPAHKNGSVCPWLPLPPKVYDAARRFLRMPSIAAAACALSVALSRPWRFMMGADAVACAAAASDLDSLRELQRTRAWF